MRDEGEGGSSPKDGCGWVPGLSIRDAVCPQGANGGLQGEQDLQEDEIQQTWLQYSCTQYSVKSLHQASEAVQTSSVAYIDKSAVTHA